MQEESADGVNSTENPFPLYGLRARTLRVLQNRPGKRRVVGEENLTSMRLRATVHLQQKCNRRKCSRDCITHVRTYVLCVALSFRMQTYTEREHMYEMCADVQYTMYWKVNAKHLHSKLFFEFHYVCTRTHTLLTIKSHIHTTMHTCTTQSQVPSSV